MFTWTMIWPEAFVATIPAFARWVSVEGKLIQAVGGGETMPTRKTPLPSAPVMLKTVMLAETAAAVEGMPQGAPTSVTVLDVLSASGAGGVRESYCRQGVM